MITRRDTRAALIDAGRTLFSTLGYEGTSVRALTGRAGANLGAVTYHFGSKEALYEAVAESVVAPLRDTIVGVAGLTVPPLERLEVLVREILRHLQEHPELPRFMIQQIASDRPVPAMVREILQANMAAVVGMIAEGQRLKDIRDGDPRLMAMSIVAQPIWLAAARRILEDAFGLNQGDEHTRFELADSLSRFVRQGLVREPQETP
ncbi:MAG: TetR/AcrR family transcriptional regulator [Gemmatimonadales bacterium]|jgi:AcrR family transcriptional regulator|nr:TetR/AcrR family transcriptional regulator [Gemmatimonadales bacterium]